MPSACRADRIAGPVPDVPQRAVFLAQAPQGKGLQAELPRGAHLVQERDRVEKPHHVALVIVLVDVLEVRIERVVVEIEVGVGVGGALPGIGDGEILGIEDLRLAMPAILWIGNGERPVVAVVAHRADQLLLGHDLEHADEIGDEPLLAGHGPGIAGGLVLVVVHQHDAVGVGGDGFQVAVAGGDGHVDIEAQIARVHLGIKRLNEAQVGRILIVGDAFNVERKAAIDRVSGEKAHDLLEQRGALVGIREHISYAGVPAPGCAG